MDEEQTKAAELSRAITAVNRLDERTRNWLRRQTAANISLYDISQMSDKEILAMANIGVHGLRRLREFFVSYDIHPPCPHCGKK